MFRFGRTHNESLADDVNSCLGWVMGSGCPGYLMWRRSRGLHAQIICRD